MKKIVGIVPSASLFTSEDCYQDRYFFVNNYGKRIAAADAVPMGLLADDGYQIPGTLDQCDSILICGGGKIYPYHFQAVHYAVTSGKPLLGICLGMQAIHSYFIVAEEAKRRQFSGDLLTLYERMKQERYYFTEPVAHHWDVAMDREHVDACKHLVKLVPGTRLHRLAGAESLMGVTLHRYRITRPADALTVSALAEDGTIEAVECGDRILGVQFHPEADETLQHLFRCLL